MSGEKIIFLKMWDATSYASSSMALIESNIIEYNVYEKGARRETIWDKYAWMYDEKKIMCVSEEEGGELDLR